jgi:beta-phosphoglucomutase
VRNFSHYKAIAFDVDGTLVPSMHMNFECWRLVLGKRGYHINRNEYFLREGENLYELIFDLVRVGSPSVDFEEIKNCAIEKDAIFLERFIPQFYPGVDSLIAGRAPGHKFALVTAGRRERLEGMFDKHMLSQFDAIVTGRVGSRGKPYPDPYLECALSLGVSPMDILVVENAPLGVSSAKAAGMDCVAIASTLSFAHLSGADRVYDSFNSFVKDYLI